MIMIRAYFRSINQSVSFVLSILNMPIHSTYIYQHLIYAVHVIHGFLLVWYIWCYYVLSHHSETQWFLIWYVFDNKKHHHPSQEKMTPPFAPPSVVQSRRPGVPITWFTWHMQNEVSDWWFQILLSKKVDDTIHSPIVWCPKWHYQCSAKR